MSVQYTYSPGITKKLPHSRFAIANFVIAAVTDPLIVISLLLLIGVKREVDKAASNEGYGDYVEGRRLLPELYLKDQGSRPEMGFKKWVARYKFERMLPYLIASVALGVVHLVGFLIGSRSFSETDKRSSLVVWALLLDVVGGFAGVVLIFG